MGIHPDTGASGQSCWNTRQKATGTSWCILMLSPMRGNFECALLRKAEFETKSATIPSCMYLRTWRGVAIIQSRYLSHLQWHRHKSGTVSIRWNKTSIQQWPFLANSLCEDLCECATLYSTFPAGTLPQCGQLRSELGKSPPQILTGPVLYFGRLVSSFLGSCSSVHGLRQHHTSTINFAPGTMGKIPVFLDQLHLHQSLQTLLGPKRPVGLEGPQNHNSSIWAALRAEKIFEALGMWATKVRTFSEGKCSKVDWKTWGACCERHLLEKSWQCSVNALLVCFRCIS